MKKKLTLNQKKGLLLCAIGVIVILVTAYFFLRFLNYGSMSFYEAAVLLFDGFLGGALVMAGRDLYNGHSLSFQFNLVINVSVGIGLLIVWDFVSAVSLIGLMTLAMVILYYMYEFGNKN